MKGDELTDKIMLALQRQGLVPEDKWNRMYSTVDDTINKHYDELLKNFTLSIGREDRYCDKD